MSCWGFLSAIRLKADGESFLVNLKGFLISVPALGENLGQSQQLNRTHTAFARDHSQSSSFILVFFFGGGGELVVS